MGKQPDYDVVGIGVGPFNLGLAALCDGVKDLRAVFFDERPTFDWHPGLLLDGATLQVPFLADLVSLVCPTSRWSFLNYLHTRERLFAYSFMDSPNPLRSEYNDYCQWVANSLPSCRFGTRIESVSWDADHQYFVITTETVETGQQCIVTSRNIAVGIGTEPVLPAILQAAAGDRIFHSAQYLEKLPGLDGYRDITVIGSGQSGAEIFLDLLQQQGTKNRTLRWITRSRAFRPMAYSQLGLEHFTPDYTRYFYSLEQSVKDEILPSQWNLYNAISEETLAAIYGLLYERTIGGRPSTEYLTPAAELESVWSHESGCELSFRQVEQDTRFMVDTECVIAATGYRRRPAEILKPIEHMITLDEAGRYRIGEGHKLFLNEEVAGSIFIQNAEAHTHGVSAPDLGLGACRNANIINSLAGRTVYRLPRKAAFTHFDPPYPAV
ncbi:SidA/IucD/PvdA family monooxygenase [Streptomyces sp900105245]|uniref:L-lysine N6-monooxygenase MbtG n=1 Tax=Streptomyces sp. 900105245 TaxID=3154379 RepID=A0ABV1UKI1_9ACTN